MSLTASPAAGVSADMNSGEGQREELAGRKTSVSLSGLKEKLKKKISANKSKREWE